MWGRLSDVANNVAGLVTPANADQSNDDLVETKSLLESTEEELRNALQIIKDRDREISSLSHVNASSAENRTADDIENIRHKLAKISIDDSEIVEDVITEISFSLSEKASTIEHLQNIIREMKDKQDHNTEFEANSPTCNEFYESQISRLTDLCTSLRQKEKTSIAEVEGLRCELAGAKAEVGDLKATRSDSDTPHLFNRLEEENKLLLSKVASEAAHKDILRDQLDTLKENNQEKFHLLESIKELQEALQSKTAELGLERERVSNITKQCDGLQGTITDLLSEKQKKLHNNLFEVKESETREEELERVKVENKMLINKISDLMASRDQAREEVERMTERTSSSRDALLCELRSKECELVDAMMIVSLLQEQIKDTSTQDKVGEVLSEIKERNQLAPKLNFLQAELAEARKQLEEYAEKEAELKNRLADAELKMAPLPPSSSLATTEDLEDVKDQLHTAQTTLIEWQQMCAETIAVWRQLIAQDGSRGLASVSEEDEQASTNELQDLITTAELLHDHYRVRCSSPPDTATDLEYMQSEVERLKDCLEAREELISGLREDINMRQEKESSYREKVAELYNHIEKSQVGTGVKDVIDFSDSFVSGLEEQLYVAQRILKIKDEEIAGLNKVIKDTSSRPRTPTSPAPRYDSILDNNVKELNLKVTELNKQLVDEREETLKAQISIEELTSQISTLQKDIAQKDLDLKRIEKEYETEMISMSTTFKDQKAVNCEELSDLTVNLETLRSEIRDLTRENMQLREMYERADQEHSVVNSQIGDPDDYSIEISALQSKYNLKEHQLLNAISEIDDLRENLRLKSDAFSELEQSLTKQREVNVKLQNSLNELKDKCESLSAQESDFLKLIKDGEKANKDFKANQENCEKDLEAIRQKYKRQELVLHKFVTEFATHFKELRHTERSLKSDLVDQLNEFNSQCTENIEQVRRQYENLIADNDVQIKSLENDVQKLKTTGKKIIDKLKKQLKDKDITIKNMASNSGDSMVVALEEEKTELSKQVQQLDRDNDKLRDEVSSLTKQLQDAVPPVVENNLNDHALGNSNPFTKQVESFITEYQKIFHCQIIESDLDIDVFSVASPVMINLAQENVEEIKTLKCDLKERICNITSLESENSSLKEKVVDLKDEMKQVHEKNRQNDQELSEWKDNLSASNDLQTVIDLKEQEIKELSDDNLSLRRALEASGRQLNQNSEKESLLQQKIEQFTEHVKEMQAQISRFSESCDSKDSEIARLSDRIQLLIADCEDKDASVSELILKCEELERTLDTLSAQVSYLAEEKESFEKSMNERCEELETSICTSHSEVATLKTTVESKTTECRKYLAMIKKMKMMKENSEKSIHELEQKLADRSFDVQGQQLTMECINITTDKIPEVTQHVQNAIHSQPCSDNNLVITETNFPPVHSSMQTNVPGTRDVESQSEESYSCQDDTISSLQAEVVQLYTELRSVEDSCATKDDFIASLSEQLNCSKQLLENIRVEYENKSCALHLLQETHDKVVKGMQSEIDALLEKEKELLAKSSLTEAEAVRLMSGKPQVQEADTTSEVSHASAMSHDTSYMSISSICKEMPNDIESLQAELMKKNKLSFLIKTKTKKLESKVRDAKREAERSKAHDKVKEKIAAVETELANITAQLRNLSTGKKIESQASKIDPKYVEEIESKLNHLTQIEQKYENLMEELQIQLHSRNLAEDEAQQMNHTINDLEDRIDILQNELRNKDALLCDHFDASADEELKINSLREQFEQQNSELLHLRDLNKKMKEALIEVTEESARIEQTYKATMHELEGDVDRLKGDNATLSNELTICWTKIEDLEEQNQNYMDMLEDTHEKLKDQISDTKIVEGLRSENEALVAQICSYTDSNKGISEKFRIFEEEKRNVIKELDNLKQIHDECLYAKEKVTKEKEELIFTVKELETKIKNHKTNYELNLLATDEAKIELSKRKDEIDTLKQNITELQEQLEEALKAEDSSKTSLSSKLKSTIEDASILRNQLDESQFLTDSLQQQLNMISEEKSNTIVQLEKVHNQLNNLISEHEECSNFTKSLESHVSSIQKQLNDKSKLVESLKEEQNLIMESNIKSIDERESEIKRLAEICKDNEVVALELTNMKTAYQFLEDENKHSGQLIKNLMEGKCCLESKVETLQIDIDTIFAEKSELCLKIKSQFVEIESLTNELSVADVLHNETNLANQTEIKSMEKSLAEKEKILSQIQHKLQSLQDDYSNSPSIVDSFQNYIDIISAEKSELCLKITSQIEEIKSLTGQLSATDILHSETSLAQQTEIESKDKLLAEKEENLSQIQNKLQSLQDDYSNSSSTCTDLTQKVSETQKLLDEFNELKLNLEQRNQELEKSNADYLEQLQDANYKLEQWIHYNEDQQKIFIDYQAQVSVVNEQNCSYAAQLTESDNQLNSLKGDLLKTNFDNKELSEALSNANDLNKEKCEEIDELNSAIINLRSKKVKLEQELSDSVNNLKGISCELIDAKDELRKSCESRDNLRAKMIELEAEIVSIANKKDKVDEENNELKVKLMAVDGISIDECNKLKCQVEELEGLVQEKELKIDSTESLVLENEQKMHELEQKIGNLNKILSDKDSFIQLLEQQLDDAYSGNEEATTLLNNENHILKDENCKLTGRNQHLLQSNDTLESGITKLHDSLEHSKVTIQNYEGMLTDWTTYGEQREAYIIDLNGQLKSSQASNEELATSITLKNEQIFELNQNVEGLKKMLENVSTDKLEVDNQLRDLSEKSIELNNLQSAFARLSDNHTELEQKILELSKDLKTSNHEKEAITRKAKDVMKAYKESKISVERLKKESTEKENEQIVNLNSQMDELKISHAAFIDSNNKLKLEKAELISEVQQFESERALLISLKDENQSLKETTTKHYEIIEDLKAQLDDIKNITNSDVLSLQEAAMQADGLLTESNLQLDALQKEFTKKSDTLDNLSNLYNELKENLQSKISEMILKDTEMNELRSMHVQHQLLCEDLGLEFEKFDEVLPNLVKDLSDKTNNLNSINSHIDSFINYIESNSLIEVTENQATYEEKFAIVCCKMTDLSKNVYLSESELQMLRTKTETLERDAELLQSATASLDKSGKINEELQRKVEFLERDRSEHEHTVELLHQKFESNYQELDNVKSILSKKEHELSEITNQFQTTITKLANAGSRIKELEKDTSSKDSEKLRLQQNFEDQIKHFHDSSAELQDEVNKSRQEIDSLQADKDSLEQDLLAKCNKITAVLEEMDGYKNQIVVLTNELGCSQDGYKQLLNKLQLTEAEFESVSKQLTAKDSAMQHLENEIVSIQRRLEAANSPDKDEELLNAIRQKDDLIEELRSKLDTLSIDYRNISDNNNQQSQLFDSERSSMLQEIKSLQNNLASLKAEIETKNSYNIVQSNEISDLQQKLDVALDSNIQLKTLFDDANQNLSDTKLKLDEVSALKEKIQTDLRDVENLNESLKANCSDLSTQVCNLDDTNSYLEAELSKLKLDHNVLKKSLSDHNKLDTDVISTKIKSFQELNETLENSLLKSEEQIGEITADYEQKCLEVTAIERDLSSKKRHIFDLEGVISDADRKLNDKSTLVSQLQADFDVLVSTNAALEEKTNKFTSENSLKKSNEFKKLTSDLEEALVNSNALLENNALLVANNTQLTNNYKQLHESISVYQQRDAYLTEMSQKLQNHIGSLEDHIKKISNEFISKMSDIEIEKKELSEQLSSVKSSAEDVSQVSALINEVSHLTESKNKLVNEVEVYQGRLKVATAKAENLEKSLLDLTTRYNDQCSVVEKKTADITKLSKQYKYLKQKLVNELNNRKSFLQETISGKDKVVMQIGEKSKRLKELQGQLISCQKDRETLTSAVEGILDSLAPLRGKVSSGGHVTEPCGDNFLTVLETVEHKTKDILAFLARPLPSSSLLDLSSYRTDSDLLSDYSFAPSDTISDSGENRSLRSENFSLLSDITNNSIQNYSVNQAIPIIRDRNISDGSSASERLRASSEISRTATGVMSRLASSFTGQAKPPSYNGAN